MPRIEATAHALPPHTIRQQEIKSLVARLFTGKVQDLDAQLSVFDNSRIDSRQFVMPGEWYLTESSYDERNRIYLEHGTELLSRAARRCLDKAALSATEIDHVIVVSSTGFATPSLDARIINRLGLNPTTTRLPIWGLGCAAGAAGLARANDYCRAYPDARVLLLALECCSLTLAENDTTRKNLVGTALFSDGAAATLVIGDRVSGDGPEIRSNCSYLFPDTARIMGWDFQDGGMRLVLSPKLPALIQRELPHLITSFLTENNLKIQDVRHYITHPGGARVIDAYKQALDLSDNQLALTEQSLRKHGNISSVSVLLVLEEWLKNRPEQQPGYGLLSAFGPGFSAEMLLLEV